MIREGEEKEMKGFVSPTKMIMMVVVIGEDSKTNKKNWANAESWTRDLFLTKEALYHWATPASDFFERETGFEPATFSLEGWRSTNWATPAIGLVGRAGFEPTKA